MLWQYALMGFIGYISHVQHMKTIEFVDNKTTLMKNVMQNETMPAYDKWQHLEEFLSKYPLHPSGSVEDWI